jgi:energy-coupling factor transport system substrate-specific component
MIAASVSFLLASQWSVDAIFSGAAQGIGAELAFAAVGYRVAGWRVALVAGALSGVGMALHDLPLYFPDVSASFAAALVAAMVASSAIIGGFGALLLRAALRRSGALDLIGS